MSEIEQENQQTSSRVVRKPEGFSPDELGQDPLTGEVYLQPGVGEIEQANGIEIPESVRGARRLGQCCAELPGDRGVWYCTKPEAHDGQHEATVKWG